MGTVILPPSPNWYASHLADVGPGLHAFCAHNSIVVLDSGGTRVCDVLKGHSNRTTAVAFVHDDDNPATLWIVSASSDKTVRLWTCTNLQQSTFSCRRSLSRRPAEVKAIAATSRVALVGDTAGNLFIWHVATCPERMQRLDKCHQASSITCIACSPRIDHSVAAVGCANGEVAIIDWAQGTTLRVLRDHNVEVHCLRWSHLGVEDVDTQKKCGKESTRQQLPNSVELLVSAAPGERLRIYEARSVGAGACSTALGNTDAAENSDNASNVVFSLGEDREIALISTLQHPKPPGNLAQGQRHRLWLSADWLPAPVVRRHGNGTLDLWMLTSGYGGGLLARRVILPCAADKNNNRTSLRSSTAEKEAASAAAAKIEAEEGFLVRLPGGHSRTVFSVRCMLDLSREEPGVRILTIGMDRAAMAWWAPVPRLHRNFYLEAENEKSLSSCSISTDDASARQSAACEAERKAWQRTDLVGSITGLGSFPQAISISPRRHCLQGNYPGNTPSALPLQPKVAVGCGDGSIRILPFYQNSKANSSAVEEIEQVEIDMNTSSELQQGISCVPTVSIELDTQASTLIWQGIPAAITTVLWHPSNNAILAFGCSDGSVGLAHSEKGTAILATSKHKSGISHMGWVLETRKEEKEENLIENNDGKNAEEPKGEEEKRKTFFGQSKCRLLTLSSDGSLYQWDSWSESSLSDLFPAQIKQQQQQQQQQQGTAAVVTPRTELGRPSPFLISQPFLEGKTSCAPTCIGSGENGVGNTVVGCVDGSIVKIEQGGFLEFLGSSEVDLPSPQQLEDKERTPLPLTPPSAVAAVSHVGIHGNFYASFHTDKTLKIGDFSGLHLKTPVAINLAADEKGEQNQPAAGGGAGGGAVGASVMSMALVSKETSNDIPTPSIEKAEEPQKLQNSENVQAFSLVAAAVYVALGLQDGTIQIWGLILKPKEEEQKEEEGEEQKCSVIELLAVLRGHAGPVVSLEWISTSSLQSKETRVVLFSGSEDQSVRKWDLLQILLKKQVNSKHAESLTKSASASAVGISIPLAHEDDENVPPPPPPPLLSEEMSNEAGEKEEKERLDIPKPPLAPAPAPQAAVDGAPPAPAAKISKGPTSSSSSFTENKGKSTTSTATLAATHQVVSLGSKGLLPPSLPRAESLSEQAPLDAALLALTSRIASPYAAGIDHRKEEEEEPDYFATLGCIVDPLSAVPALHQASDSLLSGPSQRPVAARVFAQRTAAVSLWSGDVGSAINVLVENDALTADFVSFSAAAGRGAWEAASRAYAYILEEKGETHLAALHLASIGDPVSACKVYTRAGMVREAATLAIAKLPPRHHLVLETRAVYALQLEGRGDFERAAAQYIASENWQKAIEMLQKRGTVGSLQTALKILSIVQLQKQSLNGGGGAENGNDSRDHFISQEEAEKLKQTLQDRLSLLKSEGLDSSFVKITKELPRTLCAQDIQIIDEEQRRHRYSTTALEEIKMEMAKTSDGWNEQFRVIASKQFPNISLLLKEK